jgi:squalene-hopene/tetraprenyl-beta-curcumene cyclase
MVDWLLNSQHRERNSMTGATPGGWAWSDLSGTVPDVDDTASALVAMHVLANDYPEADVPRLTEAAILGVRWLLKMQNRDGGWGALARGGGKASLDRSGADLTAHAVRAFDLWRPASVKLSKQIEQAISRGLRFLSHHQRPDGSWSATRFGNEHQADGVNSIYGTSRVVLAWRQLGLAQRPECRRGLAWLVANQNVDGGWGGASPECAGDDVPPASTIEETAMAVEALAGESAGLPLTPTLTSGVEWLVSRVEEGEHLESSPIGLTFAGLWYYERLYPLIFTVAALGRAVEQFVPREQAGTLSRRVIANS